MRAFTSAFTTLLLACAACAASPGEGEDVSSRADEALEAGGLREVKGFGPNPGALRMFEHVPRNLPPNAPVVVVLHGCMTTAANIAGVGWNELADQRGFVVVYPQQSYLNNGTYCFNWADPMGFGLDDAERGGGESESVREMTLSALARHQGDPGRVFAAGFSAGAAMAVDLAAVYPDLYAGVASFAGVPYGCASTLPESAACMIPGIQRTAAEHARRVKAAFPSYTGRRPRMSIWQGGIDNVVYPQNQSELVKQWSSLHGVSAKPSATQTSAGVTHAEWKSASGEVVLETYLLANMWHGFPVDPAHGCGKVAQFVPDMGICGASRVADFFGL